MWLWILISPVLLYLAVVICMQVFCYLRCKFYAKQGFKMCFDPVLGHFSLLMPEVSQQRPKDQLSKFKRILGDCGNSPGIVTNDWRNGKPLIFLKDFNLIKEFFVKELTVTNRFERDPEVISFSFFFQNTPHSLEMRSAFSEIFKIDFIESMAEVTRATADNQIRSLFTPGQKEVEVDFKKFSIEFLMRNSPRILFSQKQEFPRLDGGKGELVSQSIYNLYSDLNSSRGNFSPLNTLLLGYPSKYNLMKVFKDSHDLARNIQAAIMDYFNQRSKMDACELGQNVVDIMVRDNKASNKFNQEEVIAWVVLFLFGGTDTTGKMFENIAYYLARDPNLQKRLRKEITESLPKESNQSLSFEKLDQLVLLDAVVKEALRENGLAPFLFERIATKDFTLGEYKIRKGDLLNVPISYFHSSTDNYETGSSFDVENFMKKDSRPGRHAQYHPFSLGKRSCPGKYFAEMTIKIFVMSLVTSVELTSTSDAEGEWVLDKGYEIKALHLKCRELSRL